eukprot:TRINITY_DN945_c0_g2_i1.p1 TRINITY_DN945_c0_g2~~TRINITY_DN945_c0_g2_i1.p1  ORF type:complete len:653 (-),score=233.85 TRINITY_DN945_c0_g2_i1:32-1990(-)
MLRSASLALHASKRVVSYASVKCLQTVARANVQKRIIPVAASPVTMIVHNNMAIAPRVFIRTYADYPSHMKLGMPALSPTMTAGNIASWNKKEGDKINAGDSIADIETDKSTMAFESAEDGYLAKILYPAGSKDVPVNTLVAIMVDNQADVAKFADYKDDSAATKEEPTKEEPKKEAPKQEEKPKSAPAKEEKPAAPKKTQKAAKSYPSHITVGMPALSPTMAKGNIAKWRKKEGDAVKSGDIIAEIETDKSTMEFECTEDGFIAKILCADGSTDIDINSPIAIMVENKDDISKFADYTASASESKEEPTAPESDQIPIAEKSQPSAEASSSTTTQKAAPARKQGERIAASPLARALSKEHDVDLSAVSGTGPDGRIIKADILEFVEDRKSRPKQVAQPAAAAEPVKQTRAAPTPAAAAESLDYTDVSVGNIRKVTAQRLSLSKQTIPHYYLTMEIRVDQLQKLRAELNAQANNKYKLSVNDFIIKAAALSMRRVPIVNSAWNDTFIRRYNNVDINVAVNTDQGLFTPIVKEANKKGLSEIANAVKSLAEKAKEGKLQPAEFQGGTFTISNLGMFGIKNFSAVINPPQAAILAVGGAEKRLIPKEGGEGQYDTATILTVTLSCDHRVIDGAVGAEWLQAFKDLMENPIKMLL